MISKSATNFNKEILFGEIGAVVGSQALGYSASVITSSANLIAASASVGATLGAAIFFLSLRIYNKLKENDFSGRKLANDLLYFTPVAFIISISVYYPMLFFLDRYMLNQDHTVIISTFISQIIAFASFLICMNIYRYGLLKVIGKKL